MTEKPRPFTAAAYYQFLREHRLMGARCKGCGALYLPPRPRCTSCHGHEMEWVPLQGRGKLSTFTSIYVAPASMTAKGYGRTNPYCTGVVELKEGPRISARILDVDARRPETIKVGMPLQVDFSELEGERPTLAFRPA